MKSGLPIFVFASLFFFGLNSHAASGDPSHIPLKTIFFQALNLSLLVGFLVYFLKSKVQEHFKSRADGYHNLVQKAEAAKKQAEAEHKTIKERLAKLENDAEANKARAKSEALEIRNRIIADAETLGVRLKEEAGRSAKFEMDKAVAHLRENMLTEAISQAHQSMQNKINPADQKRLQNEFVDKIQVVQG